MKQTLALVTLAVEDLDRALAFYRDGLGWTPHFATGEIAFFQMNGFALSLYRKDHMAAEIGGPVRPDGHGIALAHNVASKEEVDAVLDAVRGHAASVRDGVEREWGGYSGYFEDPDGHLWEVAWNPHWTMSPEGYVTM